MSADDIIRDGCSPSISRILNIRRRIDVPDLVGGWESLPRDTLIELHALFDGLRSMAKSRKCLPAFDKAERTMVALGQALSGHAIN